MNGACYEGRALCGLKCGENLDGAMYYFAGISGYNALCNVVTYVPEPPYYVFLAFSELYKLGTFVKPEFIGEKLYACAAKGENGKALMVVNAKSENVELDLKNIGNQNTMELCILDDTHNLETVRCDCFKGSDICTTMTLAPETIILIKIGGNDAV